MHVRHFREEAMKAVQSVTFKGRMTAAQRVARHCYALTYQREYVEEMQQQGRRNVIEEGGEEGDYLHPTCVLSSFPNQPSLAGPRNSCRRPFISFPWIFWQELVQLVQLDLM